ncbi:MAG: hypothetical protein OEV08_06465, partial [Nitrospira sp.]|nr:hypothetical protein [Nitrospira sp.]
MGWLLQIAGWPSPAFDSGAGCHTFTDKVVIMPLIPEPLYHRLVQLRRVLHEYPELSGQEANTAAVICKFL